MRRQVACCVSALFGILAGAAMEAKAQEPAPTACVVLVTVGGPEALARKAEEAVGGLVARLGRPPAGLTVAPLDATRALVCAW